jgi:hypothetical protein
MQPPVMAPVATRPTWTSCQHVCEVWVQLYATSAVQLSKLAIRKITSANSAELTLSRALPIRDNVPIRDTGEF